MEDQIRFSSFLIIATSIDIGCVADVDAHLVQQQT